VPLAEAAEYIRQTRNTVGQERDLAVLQAAILAAGHGASQVSDERVEG
jgi:hypothetical protein